MAKRSGNGAFIFGSIIGGAVGSALALWNTPQSGKELRQKLGIEPLVAGVGQAVNTGGASYETVGTRLLGVVEKATAPLVGVHLGQTANNSQPGYTGPEATTEPVVAAGDVTNAG